MTFAIFHDFELDFLKNKIFLAETVIRFESAVKFYIGVYEKN